MKRLSSSSSSLRGKGSNMGTLYYLLIFICKYKTVLKNKAYGKKSTTLICLLAYYVLRAFTSKAI